MALAAFHARLVGRTPWSAADALVRLLRARREHAKMGSSSIYQSSPYLAETKSSLTAEAAQNWVRFVIHPPADGRPTSPNPNWVRFANYLPAARRTRPTHSPSSARSRIVESSGMRHTFALLLIATSLPL